MPSQRRRAVSTTAAREAVSSADVLERSAAHRQEAGLLRSAEALGEAAETLDEAITILEAALVDSDPLAVRTAELGLAAARTPPRAHERPLDEPRARPVELGTFGLSRNVRSRSRETVVNVRLSIPSFGLAALEETVIWTGRVGNTSFPVTVPPAAAPQTHLGCFSVFVGPLQICRLWFELAVRLPVNAPRLPVRHRLRETRVRSAFASYATEDRTEVLARVQGMLKVIPDLDLFVDVLDLRSGDRWEARLQQEIAARDMFYLFWSIAASRSRWVDRERRAALALRGLDHIDPVPLQPPTVAPPPPELAALHFNEWTLAFTGGARTH